jgi:hypothetical protein
MTMRLRHVRLARLVRSLALVAALPPGAAWGATAGTGTFDIDVNGIPPNVTFDGTLTFANQGHMVGGTAVNLGMDVGAIPYSGSAVVNVQALSATFDLTASKTGFAFTGAGSGACTGGCINGTATFVGALSSLTDPSMLLPPGYAYTFDGSIFINFLGQGPGGTFALNAFADVPTPAGSNVAVSSGLDSYFDTRSEDLRQFLCELVFTTVNTPGITNFFGVTLLPGTLPNGITLIPDESVFIDVVTTAGYTGPVDVCVAYTDADMNGVVDGTNVLVSQLRLLHALATGQSFTDVTTTVGSGKVCGQVMGLSPFVVAAGPVPTTTSTSSSTVPTTTVTTTSVVPTTTTTLPELLAGKKLLLKDKAGKPQKRGLDCLVMGGITLGAGNGSDDDPVANGGSLRVRSASFDSTYPLPATGWKYVGKEGQEKGYKFGKGDAIKSVLVKNGKLLRILGKGSGLGHSLATNPDPVSVTLALGDRRYCLRFGGTVQFKDGTKFLAKGAAAPADCGSPSGAFLD